QRYRGRGPRDFASSRGISLHGRWRSFRENGIWRDSFAPSTGREGVIAAACQTWRRPVAKLVAFVGERRGSAAKRASKVRVEVQWIWKRFTTRSWATSR